MRDRFFGPIGAEWEKENGTFLREFGSENGLAAVNTFGPIMHQFKSAVSDLMVNRDAALLHHEHTHRSAAIGLRREAANFVTRDEINAENLRVDQQ